MWECTCVNSTYSTPLLTGINLMWMPVMSFLRECWQLSLWQEVQLLIEELESDRGVRQDLLSAQWPSPPCQVGGLLSSWWNRTLEGFAQASSIPFNRVFFHLPTLGPLYQRRALLKQIWYAHRGPVLCLCRHLGLCSDVAHGTSFPLLQPPQIQCQTMACSGQGQSIHLAWTGDLSLPCLGANQHLYTPQEQSPDFYSLSICPNPFLISQMGLSAAHRTPGLGYPVCAFSHSLPGVSVHMCSLPFPLCPLPDGQILAQCFSSHPTQICLYLSYSIAFIGELLPISSQFFINYSTSSYIFDVFVGRDNFHIIVFHHVDLLSANFYSTT